MSIDPIGTTSFTPDATAGTRTRPVAAVQAPDSGNDSQSHTVNSGSPDSSASSSGEEVRLQRDRETGEPVYEFLDRKTGTLIVQIPSQQMLNLIHVIQQQLARLSAGTEGAPAAGKDE